MMNTILMLLAFRLSVCVVYKDHVTNPSTLYGYNEDTILSQNGHTQLKMQDDGNLVLYFRSDNTTAFGSHSWASYTYGNGPNCYVTLHDSGDLILYGANNITLWHSMDSNSKSGSAPFDLIVSDDKGVAYILDDTNTVVWSTRSLSIYKYITSTYTLYAQYNDNIRSNKEEAELRMQPDGNLVLYRLNSDGTESATWASDTQSAEQGYTAVLHDSGDLIIYKENDDIHWSSDSEAGIAPFYLIVSDDVVAYIVDSENTIVWSTDGTINQYPTQIFTIAPTSYPTKAPTLNPTEITDTPSIQTNVPSIHPTNVPSSHPSSHPLMYPTHSPLETYTSSLNPIRISSINPTKAPLEATTNVLLITSTHGASDASSTTQLVQSTVEATIFTTANSETSAATMHTPKTSTYVTQETEQRTTSQTKPHIVNIRIEFNYQCSLHCDIIPFNTLYTICYNISHDLLQMDILRIKDSCVSNTEYVINMNPRTHYVSATATIYVCNENTLLVLSNLADIVIQQPILIDYYMNPSDSAQTTTFNPIETTYFQSKPTNVDSDETFVVIVTVFASVLTLCILIVVISCIKYGGKDMARNEKAVDRADYMQYENKNAAARYRIPTISDSRPQQQMNEMKMMDEEDEDFNMDPGSYRMSVNALNVNVNIPMSAPRFGVGAISVESGTMSPYSSVVAKEMMADIDINTIGNLGEIVNMERDKEKEVKEWLISNVGSPQYYKNFIYNGYDSLNIIEEITDSHELEEIGVLVEDIEALMREINKLKDNAVHHKNSSEGVPNITPQQSSDANYNDIDGNEAYLSTMQLQQIGENSQLSLK